MTTTARRLLVKLAFVGRWSSSTEMSDEMRCSDSIAKRALVELEAAGLTRRVGKSRATRWSVTEAGADAVIEMGEPRPTVLPPPPPVVHSDPLAACLAGWMDERGLGPGATAKMLGTSQSCVSRWALGYSAIGEKTRPKVEALLGGGGAKAKKGMGR